MNVARRVPAFLLFNLVCVPALADSVTPPHTFTSGTPAVAAEVNENFNAVSQAVNDNDTRIAQLEAQVAALQDYINQLQSVMTMEDDNQGNPSVVFSGVNLHVNNGEGQTNTINGLGNLIVGYDEDTTLSQLMCSRGTYNDQVSCENAGYQWLSVHKTGSHNLVVGSEHNYSQYGGLVAGFRNSVTNIYASITGGIENMARGNYSSVSAGLSNSATFNYSSVSGGRGNTASGDGASISGGQDNTASGQYSSVGGGMDNVASGTRSSVSGGDTRTASGSLDWVAGGLFQDN